MKLDPPKPPLGETAPDLLTEMEARLATMVEQAYAMRSEVARMHAEVARLRNLVRPRLPWKFWWRHQIKSLLKLHVVLGKLEFTDFNKKVEVEAPAADDIIDPSTL